MRLKLIIILLFSVVFDVLSNAQCEPNVPTFNVNLTGNPGGTWNSPNVVRVGSCCGNSANDKCVYFIVTLDPGAVAISFNIISGAIPGGALFYQVDCGPQTPLGQPICLSGIGPHKITFCKPGNNNNVYQITSIPRAVGGSDITVNDGCIGYINATGFSASTVVWNSIYPGVLGAYNSYLSCTSGCVNPTVTGSGTLPSYVDYQVCGAQASSCDPLNLCDTVRITFNPTLLVNIIPQNPTICFGQTSTTLTANGIGGTPPYNYLWNTINPSQSIVVGNGTYTVKLSDASGCPPVYATVTVTSYSVAISANAGSDKTVCNQNPITTLNGSVSGASGGFWSGGSGIFSPNNTTLVGATYSPTIAELAAGFVDLTLTTTGNGSCTPSSDIVRINYIGFTGAVSFVPTPVSCFGGNNGSATVSITGGISPFTYSWNTAPVQSTATATNLALGTYSATITDGIGCTSTNSVTITQPLPLALASSITHVSCSGGSNGSISVIPTGGTDPYTYLWSNGSTTPQISNLLSQNYTITVTDSKACQITSTYTITQPSPIMILLTPTPVSCFGGTNGTAGSTVSGGAPPYTYNWSSGATFPNASGLPAGTFTLTITDNSGCLASNSVTITQPSNFIASITSADETCNYLNNGTATAVSSGGNPGYTYLWQPGALTSASINNLTSGTYTLTATDSKGCTATAFATITEPELLTITYISQVNVSCFAGNDGIVTASPSGGTPNYTYFWAPGGSTTATKTNLTAGTYTVTITDSKGCTATNPVVITQPTVLSASISITNETCNYLNNGTALAVSSGGTPGYTYLWSNGATISQISNLTSQNYSVTVTDSKGCSATANAIITEPAPLTISFTAQTNVSCFAGGDGAITASPSGGTPGYAYLWVPGGATNATNTNLPAGTYTVTITDSLGCNATNLITITQPAELSANTTTTNETCTSLNDGTATTTASGGTPGYIFLWSNGSTTSQISNLSSQNYTVTVTDSKGCTTIANAIITEPAPLEISFTGQKNCSCFAGNDGYIAASPSGGTANYSYSWMPGSATTNGISNLTAGTYTVTVTDNAGCVATNSVVITQPTAPLAVSVSSLPATCYGGSNGSVASSATGGTGPFTYIWMPGSITGQNIPNLSAGTYTVAASDSNGCLTTNSVTVTQASEIILTTSSVNSDCGQPNGQTSVSVFGGNSPYTYLWSPSGGTNALATGLLSGAYTVVVTDFSGCISTQFGNVNENAGPIASIFSVTNVSCPGGSDGSATAATSGGLGPFTYSWMPSGGTNLIATGLAAGSYTVTITGANGCQALATTGSDITQPSPILITLTKSSVSCFGGNDGTASAIASGGTPGYSYQWLPSLTTGANITNLSATTFTIQVTDTNNCVQTEPFTITQPPEALSLSLSFTPVSCFAGTNGSVSASASGGTAPYNYSWMPGNSNGSNLSNLAAGTYTLTTTDSKGCIRTDSITVTQPPLIILTTSSSNSSCSLQNGQASVSASGGTGSFLYQWSPSGGTNAIASAMLSGSYTVSVTDFNGCFSTAGVIINDNASPVATVSSITNVTCNGGSDGTATVSVSGGSGPFTYSWLPSGGTNSTANGLLPGIYTVTVTDINLCQSNQAISPEITQPAPILINMTKSNVSCFGGNNGTALAIASGGTPSYTYQWLPSGNIGTTITNLSANTYTIQVTDSKSCIKTLPFIITEPNQLTPVISSVSNVSCFGLTNGTATVTVSGGTPVYYYNWLPSGGNGPMGTNLSAGTYTVTITDFNGCTNQDSVAISQPTPVLSAVSTGVPTSCFGGSNGMASINTIGGTPAYSYQWTPSVSTNATASGLSAGNYTILVTDSKNCKTNVSVSISEPSAITGTLAFINPSCGLSNGSISSQLSGGVFPYSYLWSWGASTNLGINNLGPGTYSVQVTDSLNCTFSLSVSLTNIPGPSVVVSSTNNVSCYGGNNGSATINIIQGTAPYTINWAPSGGNNLTSSLLSAGTYTVNVTDAIGCQSSDSTIIAEPTPIDVSISSINNVLCNGGNTGSISVSATGGTGSVYTYTWAPISSSSSTANNLTAGTYTVNVKDQNNCVRSISALVTQPTVLSSAVASVMNPICFNGTGSASVTVNGGTLPYTYFWSAPAVGQTGSTANNLIAGSYTAIITDTNGCTANSNVLITQPLKIITIAGSNDTICLGQSGNITATATGGAGNYYYAWQPSGAITTGTLPINPTSNTNYTVVAYDQIGCPGTPDSVTAIVYTLTGANVQAIGISPICPGQNSTLYVETSGTTGPLTYQWNNNVGTGPGAYLVTPAQPTIYTVTVSNSCGLSVTDSVEVLFNQQPTISLTSDPSALCELGAVHFTDSSITGNINDPITSWYWDFGDGTSSTDQNPYHIFSQDGTFFVTLTINTDGGCTTNNAIAPLTITAYPAPVAAFSLNSSDLLIPYDVLLCSNQSVGANSYSWSFGDGGASTVVNPAYLYTLSGIFQVQLIATSPYGCLDTAYAEVTTNANVIFPNVFTPNSDMASGGSYTLFDLSNDVFFPFTYGVIDYKLEIFNRWGEQIFESLDIKKGWDGYYRGQLCQQDVYVWKAYLKLNNGKVYNLSGDLTLLK